MTSAEWSAVASIGAAVSALISFIALVVSIRASRNQTRVSEFNNAVAVQKELAEAQRRVAQHNPGSANWVFEFRELYNLLEILALLVNREKITPVAKEFTTKFLIEVLAWTETSEELKALMADATTHADETYVELRIFQRWHEYEIDRLVPVYRARG